MKTKMTNAFTCFWCGAVAMALCSCAYSPVPGGNSNVTSPRDSHDVTTVTMAPGATYAPTLVKGSDNGNGYAGGNYYDGATRFAPPNYGVVRVAPNCNPYFTGF